MIADLRVSWSRKFKKINHWMVVLVSVGMLMSACGVWASDDNAVSQSTMAPFPTNYEMVQAPTAYILMNGGYDLVTEMYENGGLFLRGNVGFKNFFMFGFSANATNVFGQGTIELQTPKLFFKFKLLDQSTAPFAMAVAWDDRGYGAYTNNRFYPGTQKGFYAVISHEYPELGYLQTHIGFNLVQFDDFDPSQDIGGFFGTSFALAKPLVFNLEADKIFSADWVFNANFLFNVDKPLRVGIDFIGINNPSLFSRILRIQYMGFF